MPTVVTAKPCFSALCRSFLWKVLIELKSWQCWAFLVLLSVPSKYILDFIANQLYCFMHITSFFKWSNSFVHFFYIIWQLLDLFVGITSNNQSSKGEGLDAWNSKELIGACYGIYSWFSQSFSCCDILKKCMCNFAILFKMYSYCLFVFPDDTYRSILERNELKSIHWSAEAVSLSFVPFLNWVLIG